MTPKLFKVKNKNNHQLHVLAHDQQELIQFCLDDHFVKDKKNLIIEEKELAATFNKEQSASLVAHVEYPVE